MDLGYCWVGLKCPTLLLPSPKCRHDQHVSSCLKKHCFYCNKSFHFFVFLFSWPIFFLFKALLLDLLCLKLSSLGQASHRAMFTLSATVVSSANTLLKYHQSIHLRQREQWNQFSEQSKCYPVTMYLCTKLFHFKSSDINLRVAIGDISPVAFILFQFATDLQHERLEFITGQLSSEIKDCVDLFSIMHIICSSIFCITYKSPGSNTTLTSRALLPESLHAELFYDNNSAPKICFCSCMGKAMCSSSL